jgi:hypothetical protein
MRSIAGSTTRSPRLVALTVAELVDDVFCVLEARA